MRSMIGRPLALLATAAAGLLSGCADYYGGGVGVGYGSRGYYEDPYYGGGYGDPYYGGYAGGYGWFGDYYYPGSGFYVFDRGGRRHRWNDEQRRHWQDARNGAGRNWSRDGRGGPGGGRWNRNGMANGTPGAGQPAVGQTNPGGRDGAGVRAANREAARQAWRANGGVARGQSGGAARFERLGGGNAGRGGFAGGGARSNGGGRSSNRH